MADYLSIHTGLEVDNAVTDVANKLNKYTGGEVSSNNPTYIVATYRNGVNWWRLWSDGWCEQGGRGMGTIALARPYVDTNYTVVITQYNAGGHETNVSVENLTTTTFQITNYNSMWYACGMTAQ